MKKINTKFTIIHIYTYQVMLFDSIIYSLGKELIKKNITLPSFTMN